MTDRKRLSSKSSGQTGLILAIVGLLALGGVIFWGFMQSTPYGEPERATADSESAPMAQKSVAPAQPDTSQQAVPESPVPTLSSADIAAASTDITPTPAAPVIDDTQVMEEQVVVENNTITLGEADQYLAADISKLSAGVLAKQFTSEPYAIERLVAAVDNLRQGEVPYKLLGLGRPAPKFPVQATQTEGEARVDPQGYARYDGLTNVIADIDTEAAANLYDKYNNALTDAWRLLGINNADLDDALMAALQLILTTPAPDPSAILVKREANWVYLDPDYERLPPLQKQLMRMGPGNLEKIQATARELRWALLDSSD